MAAREVDEMHDLSLSVREPLRQMMRQATSIADQREWLFNQLRRARLDYEAIGASSIPIERLKRIEDEFLEKWATS